MKNSRDDEPDPPLPPFPPYPPYPPAPPFPPYRALPSPPACTPTAASDPCSSSADHYGDHDTTEHEHDAHDGGDATGGDGPAGGSGGRRWDNADRHRVRYRYGWDGSTPTTPTPPQVPLVPSRISVRRPDRSPRLRCHLWRLHTEHESAALAAGLERGVHRYRVSTAELWRGGLSRIEGQTIEQPKESTPPKKDDEHAEVSQDPNYPKKNLASTTLNHHQANCRWRACACRAQAAWRCRCLRLSPRSGTTASILTALRDWTMRLDGNAAPDWCDSKVSSRRRALPDSTASW